MSERSAAIGLASAKRRRAAAEQLGSRFRDERPGDRLAQAERGERALGERACASAAASAPASARRASRRGSGVVGTRSSPAMRTICSTMSALPSMSGRQLGTIALPSFDLEAEPREDRLALGLRNVEAGEAAHFAVGEVDDAFAVSSGSPATISRDGSPPQRSMIEVRRQFRAGHAEIGIDAALEAIARVGDDAELAAGLRDVQGVPQRALDQHVARVLVAAGMLAAHHRRRSTRRRCRRR